MSRTFNLDLSARGIFAARVAKLTRADGTILRIGEADESITIGSDIFSPLPGCEISGVKHIINGETSSMQINFAHSVGGEIDTADLNNGVWDGAQVVVYPIDRANITSLADALFTGSVQVVTLDPIGSTGSFDCRGLTAEAESFIQTYQPMCRTDLFSSLCQLHAADFVQTGTVDTIVDRFNITVSGLSSPPADGWFNGGTGTSASGFNFEIANWVQSSLKLTTFLPVCAARFTAGEDISLYPGCDFTGTTCRTKFSNKINFQGEDHFLGINSIVGV